MSLSYFTADKEKPWLSGRCQDLTVDGTLNSNDVTITNDLEITNDLTVDGTSNLDNISLTNQINNLYISPEFSLLVHRDTEGVVSADQTIVATGKVNEQPINATNLGLQTIVENAPGYSLVLTNENADDPTVTFTGARSRRVAMSLSFLCEVVSADTFPVDLTFYINIPGATNAIYTRVTNNFNAANDKHHYSIAIPAAELSDTDTIRIFAYTNTANTVFNIQDFVFHIYGAPIYG